MLTPVKNGSLLPPEPIGEGRQTRQEQKAVSAAPASARARDGDAAPRPSGAEEPALVEINIQYLTFVHDMLAESMAKLEQVFGGSAITVLRGTGADQVEQTLSKKGVVEPGLAGAVKAIRSWGMSVTTRKDGESLEVEVECPYARTVHPRLASDSPRCPMGALILGAARTEIPGAGLKNDLTDTGAVFTIQKAASAGSE